MLTTRRHEEEDTFYKGRKVCEKGDKWTWSTDSKYCISASGLKYSLQGASRRLMRLKRNKTHQGYRSRKWWGQTLGVTAAWEPHRGCNDATTQAGLMWSCFYGLSFAHYCEWIQRVFLGRDTPNFHLVWSSSILFLSRWVSTSQRLSLEVQGCRVGTAAWCHFSLSMCPH